MQDNKHPKVHLARCQARNIQERKHVARMAQWLWKCGVVPHSRHLCQTPLNGGEAYPVRTWLLSWNRAIQIQNTNSLEEASHHCIFTGS